MIRQAILWDSLGGGRVRCRVCRWRCVVEPGQRGHCLTRENRGGELFTLIYATVSSLQAAPIEMKPLFHFFPGTSWLSLGSLGCNFRCPGCQNWEIAHAQPDDAPRGGAGILPAEQGIAGWKPAPQAVQDLDPAEAVDQAITHGCKGLSWTYNEPTLWLEYTLDVGRLARPRGLLAHYVTNGFATPDALDAIAPYLDAYRVDIKAFNPDAYRRLANITDFEGILETAERAKRTHGLHVECVTNIVPGYNDDDTQLGDLAGWIVRALGPDTPWHVTRFVPHLDLSDVPATPVATLERAREIGLSRGLQYVYLGNVPGHPAENTYCHVCGALLIQRQGHRVVANHLLNGLCPFCAAPIPGRWQ